MTDSINSRFFLSKWYLDCVDEKGAAIIGYITKLRWRRIEVPYTSILIFKPDRDISLRYRIHHPNLPKMNGNILFWQDPQFGIKGEWERDSDPLEARIFDSDEGNIDWQCYLPRAKVQVDISNDVLIKGMGYAEHLIMSIEPWKVPMDQLRWGRYGSNTDHLIWIKIKSGTSRQWVWYNGTPVENAEICDDYIFLPDQGIDLQLDRSRTIEKEKKIYNVVRSILAYLPGLNKAIPGSFLNSNETKWISRGILKQHDKIVSQGWAIHELVDFEEKK